jgi:hypothetical protein
MEMQTTFYEFRVGAFASDATSVNRGRRVCEE